MAFSMKEIDNAVVTLPTPENPRGFSIRYESPVTPRENFRLNLQHQGLWMPSVRDRIWFCPREIPDNIARAFIIDGERYTGPVGGTDMFGIDWEYVPSARGSIVRPGNPVLTDITCWREFTKVPDLIANCSDEDLWAPYFERVAQVDRGENLLMMFAPTGLFERTHFLMGFEDTFLNFMIEPEDMEEYLTRN